MKITNKAKDLAKEYNKIKSTIKQLNTRKEEIEGYFKDRLKVNSSIEIDNKFKISHYLRENNTLDKKSLMEDYQLPWDKYNKKTVSNNLRFTILK